MAERVQLRPKNVSAALLASQLASQQAQLKAQGGKLPSQGGSLATRIFDVFSRGNYAAAGSVLGSMQAAAAHKNPLTGFAKGAVSGLAGKEKHGFADVLQEWNKSQGGKMPIVSTNVGRAGLGLGLDIAADPLNYLSFGVTKAIPAIEAAAEGGRGIKAAHYAAEAAKSTPTPIKLSQRIAEAGKVSEEAAKATRPGSIAVKLGGKSVAELKAPYKAAQTVNQAIKNIPVVGQGVDAVNKSLRFAARYPGRIGVKLRQNQQTGVAFVQEMQRALHAEGIHKLTESELQDLTHALHFGRNPMTATSKSGIDMQRAKTALGNALDVLDQRAVDAGIDPEEILQGLGQGMGGPHRHIPLFYPSKEVGTDVEKKVSNLVREARRDQSRVAPSLIDIRHEHGLNPEENIYKIIQHRAAQVERGAVRRNMFEDIVGDYSTRLPAGGEKANKATKSARKAMQMQGLEEVDQSVLRLTSHAGGEGTVFVPKEVNEALKSIQKVYETSDEAKQLMRMFDKTQRFWKTGVTTMSPAHHVSNMMGDVFLNWVQGVRDPRKYWRTIQQMSGKGMKIGNLGMDAKDFEMLYGHGGALGGFAHQMITGTSTGAMGQTFADPSAWSAIRGHGETTQMHAKNFYESVQRATEARENFTRKTAFAHWMEDFHDNHSPINTFEDAKKAAEYAGEKVRKYNLDYGGLTRIESQIRRAVPFYTYMRQATPLMFETAALHPDLMSRIPKYFRAMQVAMGSDPSSTPVTEVVPKFIRDSMAIRLRGEGGKGLNIPGTGKNPLYFDPRLPMMDALNLFSGSDNQERAMHLLNMTAMRPLAEFAMNKSSLSGAPLGSPSVTQYASQQVPLGRFLYNAIAGQPESNKINQPGDKTSAPLVSSGIAKLLSPIKLREVTPAAQRGEIQRQLDPVQARLKRIRAKRINQAYNRGR